MLRVQHPSSAAASPPFLSPASSRRSPVLEPHSLVFSSKLPNPIAVFSLRLFLPRRYRRGPVVVSRKGSFRDDRWMDGDGDQFLEAFLLVSETIRHYSLWKEGFVEETMWHSPGQMHPFSNMKKGTISHFKSIGNGFLRRFQSPTIFLKIACDGDLVLPIVVGENAINMLIDSLKAGEHEDCPQQYQFIENLVGMLGYEIKMVHITERVLNTYYARIVLEKLADRANISVDARPSDAIIVAKRLKAPIYVSKEILVKDAINVVYGTWRGTSVRTVYDVSLDSAADGPDALSEELDLMKKINTAVMEERYEDAVMWRDKLAEIRAFKDEL